MALERALANLIENAHVHGPAGGEVTVALRAHDGRAEITVADEGPGLAPRDRGHAFDRFWRGPAAAGHPGTGLGLALVRAIAQRHGGGVRVDGSRFTIDLPAFNKPSSTSNTLAHVDTTTGTPAGGAPAHTQAADSADGPAPFTTLTGTDSGGQST
jgi:K+-sensing histidine kinase KdpD